MKKRVVPSVLPNGVAMLSQLKLFCWTTLRYLPEPLKWTEPWTYYLNLEWQKLDNYLSITFSYLFQLLCSPANSFSHTRNCSRRWSYVTADSGWWEHVLCSHRIVVGSLLVIVTTHILKICLIHIRKPIYVLIFLLETSMWIYSFFDRSFLVLHISRSLSTIFPHSPWQQQKYPLV